MEGNFLNWHAEHARKKDAERCFKSKTHGNKIPFLTYFDTKCVRLGPFPENRPAGLRELSRSALGFSPEAALSLKNQDCAAPLLPPPKAAKAPCIFLRVLRSSQNIFRKTSRSLSFLPSLMPHREGSAGYSPPR